MSDPTEGRQAGEESGGGTPYGSALLRVVEQLHDQPILLFGIGAGILVVAALAITTSPLPTIVVACLFALVLLVHAHRRARTEQHGPDVRVRSLGLTTDESSEVGVADAGTASKVRGTFLFSRVGKNSRVGTIRESAPPPDRTER
jgi:hypothetical protein